MSLQDPQSPPEPRTGRDAYWEVHPTEYVGDGPILTTGLLDDPERLKASWARVLERARREAELTGEQWDEIARRADAGHPLDLPATSEQALATLVMRDDDIGKGCPWLIAGAVAWSALMLLLGAVIW